jgi:predicted acetyltransferase
MFYSQLESERFKLNIFRKYCEEELNINQIVEEINENSVDILILRINSILKSQNYKLNILNLPFIHCDNLVYYKCDLNDSHQIVIKNDLSFVKLDNENVKHLIAIIPEIFKDYQNHYSSNPNFNLKDINDGYIEWGVNSLSNSESEISWLVFKNNEIVGFAKCSFDLKKSISEGVLFGVLPNYNKGGIYTDMIRFAKKYFKNLGFDEIIVSTQIQNYIVQRVWVREGFYLFKSYDTYHVNLLKS